MAGSQTPQKTNSVGEIIGQPNLLPKVIHLVAKRIRPYLGATDSVCPYVHTYDQTQPQKGRPIHIPKETTWCEDQTKHSI